VQCPASPQCSWTGGFAAGDSLVWSINGSSFGGTAPLGFLLDPTRGVGAFVQADNPGPFTVQLQWFDSHGSPGGSFLATSPLGDPIFIGALDLNPNNGIGAVAFNLTDGTNDLAVDSLQLNYFSSTQVPEPNLLVMLGSGIASLIGIRRWGKVSASDKN
jgi:hypothetical protein